MPHAYAKLGITKYQKKCQLLQIMPSIFHFTKIIFIWFAKLVPLGLLQTAF